MSTRVMDRVDEWDSSPFGGGYRELRTLGDEAFSGVIRAGQAELYMTAGAVVGVQRGTIEDFEDADGTVYEAPSPALPLLAVMQDQDEEARAEYYTEDTGLSKVDSKLADGGFTGYVELSENVLSGDYFVVYHQGRSMSVAFVGPESRVKTDDDARERATEEIGIYRVYPADIDSADLPEPAPSQAAESESQAEPTSDSGSESGAAPGASAVSESGAAPDSEEAETAPATAGETADDSGGTGTDVAGSDGETTAEAEAAKAEAGTVEEEVAAGAAESSTESGTGSVDRSADVGTDAIGPDAAGGGEASRSVPSGSTGSGGEEPVASGSRAGGTPTPEQGRATLETRSIPSLNPGRTQTDESGLAEPDPGSADPLGQSNAGAAAQSGSRGRETDSRQPAQPRDDTGRSGASGEQGAVSADRSEDTGRTEPDTARVGELEEELADREAEIDRLAAELESAAGERDRLEEELDGVRAERDRLEEELDGVRAERDDLEAEVERLAAELDRLESEFGAATDREERIGSREALEGTDLFVRYRSKGDPTLGDAHGSGIRQQEVVENLRLEKHTQFDADAVSVGGQTYGEFLEGRIEYQFVEWVAEELLFEIRDTGHRDALQTLYDALPEIDRAELGGSVDTVRTENGEETRSTEQFDVVYRDRMGDPLLVANINDSREAATESMMTDLVTAAERVGQGNDGFAAAFLVTESFFEPGALETASEATRRGFLKRSKRKSFVNLTRKQGYHLCLVEARSENFSLSVPEL